MAWRSFQLETARSLGRAGTLGTLTPDNQEDISSVLDELEQGLPPDSARCGLLSHGLHGSSIAPAAPLLGMVCCRQSCRLREPSWQQGTYRC